jgi:hypothetical protein
MLECDFVEVETDLEPERILIARYFSNNGTVKSNRK